MAVEIKELLAAAGVHTGTSSAEEIDEGLHLLGKAFRLSPAERDTLTALQQRGPLCDGDLPSKTGRNALLSVGLAVKIVVQGEDGHNACTYAGHAVAKMLRAGA
ncbi:MAG: hypothetical protein RLZZ373_3261 [Pseudomonadota bacterium]|jgi:hypothetical protein